MTDSRHRHLLDNGFLLHLSHGRVAAVALCGYTFLPRLSDLRLPLCSACAHIDADTGPTHSVT